MIVSIPKWVIRGLATSGAILTLAAKWLIGVLVLKLVQRATVGDHFTSSSSSSLHQFVFLTNQSFQVVALLSFVVTFCLTLSMASLNSCAMIQSAHNARQLRQTILERGLGVPQQQQENKNDKSDDDSATTTTTTTTTTVGDVSLIANDLILKVNIVEDFEAHDEHRMLLSTIQLCVSFCLTFFFAWYGALIALAMFVCAAMGGILLKKWRNLYHQHVGETTTKVNARLLDVFKNATKIIMMNMASVEASSLQSLEEESDPPREKYVMLRFAQEVSQLTLVGLVPVIMALVAWPVIGNASAPEEAMNNGFAIFVTILLLDEAHKSIINLSFMTDKAATYAEAKNAIDRFLGLVLEEEDAEDDNDSKNSKEATTTTDPHNPSEKGQDVEMGGGGAGSIKMKEEADPSHNNPQTTMTTTAKAWTVTTTTATATQLQLKGVSLTYPDREKPVFSNLSETFERGKVHGLVGESGKGKSSMVKVVAGLLTPQHGTLESWQDMKIAYVSQDQKLFARSIRENVTYGGDQNNIVDGDIWEALAWANVAEFVETLPNGLDEVLEGGENDVSGGQLQRLQLAHLYCTCKHADLVLLDEVLSALDEHSRELLINRLGDFLKDKTAIVVTHHSEMLRICQYIHEVCGSFSKTSRRESYCLAPPPHLTITEGLQSRRESGHTHHLGHGRRRESHPSPKRRSLFGGTGGADHSTRSHS